MTPEYVDAVYANVVSEETAVSTVVPKLTLGEADAASNQIFCRNIRIS